MSVAMSFVIILCSYIVPFLWATHITKFALCLHSRQKTNPHSVRTFQSIESFHIYIVDHLLIDLMGFPSRS